MGFRVTTEDEVRRVVAVEGGGWRREERTRDALEQRSARRRASGPSFCFSFSMAPRGRLLGAS